jgi:predicted transcriptional regulator of viral defense system
MDSIEGIAEWWIMRRQVRVNLEVLEKVLSQLTEKGVLEKIESGKSIRYHLKTTKG